MIKYAQELSKRTRPILNFPDKTQGLTLMQLLRPDGAIIQQALSLYLAGPADPAFDYDVRDVASKLQVLPMMYDMGGCYCIRLDGEIVSFAWDEPENLRTEIDPHVVRTVLFQGTLKHSLLRDFIPTRPSDAVDCRHCGGSGKCVPAASPLSDALVCSCGGLGWIVT